METSLHRQLKSLYAEGGCAVEVPLGDYRIDVVAGDELIEIQHGGLAAIRDKVLRLLRHHRVRVVKPIVAQKTIVKQDAKGGRVLSRRRSPKRGTVLNIFDELVYFTTVFPHARLLLDIVLVEIEEWRFPGHGRRRRRREADFQIEDQKLVRVVEGHCVRSAADLKRLVPARLPSRFDTRDLADGLQIERWLAQRIAYCLREAGTIRQVDKRRNTRVYEFVSRHAA